jgi:hypothetical protein
MITRFLASFLVVVYGSVLYGQGAFNGNWMDDNSLELYETFHVMDIQMNEETIAYSNAAEEFRFFNRFNHQMEKAGLSYDEDAVLAVKFEFQIDTLPIGFQRQEGPSPNDLIIEMTMTLIDTEVDEKLFIGTSSNVGQEPKKLNKNVKRLVREFFRE